MTLLIIERHRECPYEVPLNTIKQGPEVRLEVGSQGSERRVPTPWKPGELGEVLRLIQGLPCWLFKRTRRALSGDIHIDIDVDVEVDANMDRYFSCLKRF